MVQRHVQLVQSGSKGRVYANCDMSQNEARTFSSVPEDDAV